ncbi:uncharacterized protein EAF01_009049 [Botrytis porri]|uniref:uncharacterized protein n=1 Tax=Botrytis porri TaxID=87229 RepID=UPI0018FFCDCD|nr:uncharacterized protein EAF01_009049 [Botrytis porri]KAF7896646.1 hypothetical protein EAF01_009049 [Botrytis porri]
MSSSWEAQATERASLILEKIPREWRLSSNEIAYARTQRNIICVICKYLDRFEQEVLNHDSISILRKLRSGEWTAVQCVLASCKIACIAHQINPCLLNIMIPEAVEKARKLDECFQNDAGSVRGPLHGLPISVKDQFHVKGSDTTMGYAGWIETFEGDGNSNKVGMVDSQIIFELEEQGAVVFCKTSLPQTVLYDETINNIIGQTLNPVNRLLSCGGSSGGEAALISMGGSSLGMGTDIGTYFVLHAFKPMTNFSIAGSIRVPAAFCGIYGIKPTHNRFSYRGVANTNPGQTLIPSSVGFLSRSIEGLDLVMSSLLYTSPWLRDPAVVPIPWRRENRPQDGKRLRFGIFWWDGMIQSHPPVTRALKMVVTALENAGHEVIDWCPPSHSIPERLHPAIMNADGSHHIQKQLALSGEPLIKDLQDFYTLKPPMSLLEYQDRALQLRDYRQAYSDYWNSTADVNGNVVDAVLMPAAPHAAVIPGKWEHLAYTEVTNLLDYTALVIPVTYADKDVDEHHVYVAVSEKDLRNWMAYDKVIYDGAPVGIQIVGRVCEEEKIIGVAKIVEKALGR